MHYRDPNRPEGGNNLRPEARHLKSDASGNAGEDGYTVCYRRPRVRGMTESIEPERADRIESMFSIGPQPDY